MRTHSFQAPHSFLGNILIIMLQRQAPSFFFSPKTLALLAGCQVVQHKNRNMDNVSPCLFYNLVVNLGKWGYVLKSLQAKGG